MNPLIKLAKAASYATACPYLRKPENEEDLAGLAKYLPVVGTGIGIVLTLEFFCLSFLPVNPLLSGSILTVSWLVITGGMHMDGLMDTADGIFSHRSRERMLEIMKDSRVGNFGALAGFCIILIKLAALASLSAMSTTAALFLVPVWSRWTTIIAIGSCSYLRSEGMGKIWHATTRMPFDLILASLIPILATATICSVFNTTQLALIPIFSIIAGLAGIGFIQRVLGGQTGDTYGAVTEIAESGGLLLTALFWSRLVQ